MHRIVHFEDEGEHLTYLPNDLRNCILEVLPVSDRESLIFETKKVEEGVRIYSFAWTMKGISEEVKYLFCKDLDHEDLRDALNSGGDLTILFDVMRPDQDGALRSTLAESIKVAEPHVTDWQLQTRVHTAYDVDEIVAATGRDLVTIRKGQSSIFDFLMCRLGLPYAYGLIDDLL